MSGVSFVFDSDQLAAAWAAYEQAALKHAGPAERTRTRRAVEKFLSHPATHKLRVNWAPRPTGGKEPEPQPMAVADLDAVATVAFNDPPRGRAVYSAEFARQAIRAAHGHGAPPIAETTPAAGDSTGGLPPPPVDPFEP